jgi:hypothetical protein
LPSSSVCVRQPCPSSLLGVVETQLNDLVIKPSSPPSRNPHSRKTHELLFPSCFPANSGNFDPPVGNRPHFP